MFTSDNFAEEIGKIFYVSLRFHCSKFVFMFYNLSFSYA
jgi:hypothetical protein